MTFLTLLNYFTYYDVYFKLLHFICLCFIFFSFVRTENYYIYNIRIYYTKLLISS